MKLTPKNIMPMDAYGLQRKDVRARMSSFKAQRRVQVGPFSSVIFEHFDTIWYQVHEMLYVEKAGFQQIQEEIDAYASLMPSPGVLTFTLMFEVENPEKRLAFLQSLTGVEQHIFLQWDHQTLQAIPVDSQERTRDSDGKTSAVHFMKFMFTPAQIQSFHQEKGGVTLAIKHPNYGHALTLPIALVDMLKSEVVNEGKSATDSPTR